MGGWVGASDKASTGRAEKARVGGVGDTVNHRLSIKTSELYRVPAGKSTQSCTDRAPCGLGLGPTPRDPSEGIEALCWRWAAP